MKTNILFPQVRCRSPFQDDCQIRKPDLQLPNCELCVTEGNEAV